MKKLLGVILFIGIVLLKGLVLKILWGWFIVPLGIMEIGIAHALGFSIIITYLTATISKNLEFKTIMINSFYSSCMALSLGFIFHLFM